MTFLSENVIVGFNTIFIWDGFMYPRDAYGFLFVWTNLLGGSDVNPDVDVP